MKSLAELKRTLKPGVEVTMTGHDWFPSGKLVGIVRKVVRVQTSAVAFADPFSGGESWLHFDNGIGAKGFIFDGTNKFSVILNPDDAGKDGYVQKLMTYEVNV